MKAIRLTFSMIGLGLLGACAKEVPPRSTSDFLENPILLEATMVLCAQDRARTKYEAECVNAREAVNRMAAVEEEQRKHEFDRQSERKRQALRRTQQAVADARRHAAEMQILREEAAYLSQFSAGAIDGNVDPSVQDDMSGLERTGPTFADPGTAFGGNEPGIVLLPDPSAASSAGTGSEIDSIRQELKRRQDSSQ